MRLEHSAECDKREIINDFSAENGQSASGDHFNRFPPAGVKADCDLDKQCINIFDTAVGVHCYRKEDAERNNRYLRQFADSQPKNEQRQQSDFRDRIKSVDNRITDLICQCRGTGNKTDCKADKAADSKTD